MTKPATPSAPKPAGDDRNLVQVDENYVALTFEDRLHIFWRKHGKTVMAGIVVVLLAILANGAWEYHNAQKEIETQRDYASASTPAQLKAFVAAHPGHELAGVAQLRLADDAYAAGNAAEAISGYGAAVAALPTGPLAGRAKLGLAMAKLAGGKTTDSEAALQLLAADPAEAKGIRAEAAYQLASLASTAGHADDVKKFSDQVMAIDPASPWLQRALMLRANLPVAATAPAPASPAATPAVTFPGKGK